MVQVLLKHGHLTTQLDALRNLAIEYRLLQFNRRASTDNCIILKKLSCLKTLNLTSSPTMDYGSFPNEIYGFNVEYWETLELKFIYQLRKATIEVHGEKRNGMELLKYILKRARGLVYLTIVCAPSSASSILEYLRGFGSSFSTSPLGFEDSHN
ncbi:hypothetical protein PTKIN_Ptkin02bG0196600 [Pterospermum kingtungense]